jgi:curved DNA-binding protein CbpA
MKDYYKVLGVPRNATDAQIKQAWRNLIKACHPDVNSSAKAAEWTRELNEAYGTLSDAQAKMSYDMDLKLEESKPEEASARQTTANQTRTEGKPPPRAEPNFCCEKCNRTDSSLRISATWRVFSFINYSRKSPTVKILCGRCRVKESLAASAATVLLGWWSIWGFFWTLEALFNNARGGEQPEENNAALLNALGYQLYRTGRHQEAYEALLAAFKLKPDPKTKEGLEYLKQHAKPTQKKTFWERFRALELHPIYYHAPAGAVGLLLLFFGFSALNADSTSGSSSTAQQSPARYTPSPNQSSASRRAVPVFDPTKPYEVISEKPVFSEPEQPTPKQGGLAFSDRIVFDKGVTAPLKITTRASDGNYVMKIVDWSTGEFVASYFINRGSTLEIELPLGSYKLKFASGDKWYGMEHLFGPTTAYSYVPDKMVFYLSGDYARGHRIELIPQVGGNLETPRMKAEDW